MKEQTQIGENRTGIQTAPFDTSEILSGVTSTTPYTPGDDATLAELRYECVEQATSLGSVPVPGTARGAAASGIATLTGRKPQLLLDKLGERLAFERISVRLYDALIAKFDALGEDSIGMDADDLQRIREDEARHFAILAAAIETLGADPTVQTPCADVAGLESMGLMQVVTDPRTTLAQSLHAILLAEMADQNGWEMLIMLAEENSQNAMITDFTVALDEERAHLQSVQRGYEEATLGVSVSDEARDEDEMPRLH